MTVALCCRVEEFPEDASYIFFNAFIEDLAGRDTFGEGEPQEEPAFRMGPGRAVSKFLFHALDDEVAAMAIKGVDFFYMFIKAEFVHIAVNDGLIKSGRMKVRTLLDLDELRHDIRGAGQPIRRPGQNVLEKVPMPMT